MLSLLIASIAPISAEPAAKKGDPHYNEAGFFDIHVCHWPDRPIFFMPLFSTEHAEAVRNIEILTPENRPLLQLDLQRYRTIKHKGKPDKRAIINQIDVPKGATDGWYTARVKLHDGRELTARDYVVITRLAQAGGQQPPDGGMVSLPAVLRWEPVPGASFYQVFIRDLWNDDRLIYTSKLLDRPELQLPPELLEPGGYYSWIIHARDTNEDVVLGDFNHGSLNRASTFSVIN
jgi:hypothetical protein